MIQVAAAILQNNNGEILICRRGAGESCAHLWEFPGGKLEAGETPEACLRRECEEELGLIVQAREVFARAVHHYPERTVALTFFLADMQGGVLRKNVHAALRWVRPGNLHEFSFCPADADVVKKLIERG